MLRRPITPPIVNSNELRDASKSNTYAKSTSEFTRSSLSAFPDSQLTRKAPASYGDGVYTINGGDRPSPRTLSQAFMKGKDGLGSLKNRTAFSTFFGKTRFIFLCFFCVDFVAVRRENGRGQSLGGSEAIRGQGRRIERSLSKYTIEKCPSVSFSDNWTFFFLPSSLKEDAIIVKLLSSLRKKTFHIFTKSKNYFFTNVANVPKSSHT